MRKITALTVQKRNKERVNVFLDGEYAFSLAAITAAYLRTGQTLTPEKIAELQNEDAYEKGKDAAMQFISYRPRSESEVRRRLHEKGFDEAVIELTISRLVDLDLVSDEAFARYWVEQRETFRPRGQRALRQELREKGVRRDVIDAAVEKVDEAAAARRAAEKKAPRWAKLPRQEFTRKLGQYLQRRGFNYDIIRNVADELWERLGSSDDGYQ